MKIPTQKSLLGTKRFFRDRLVTTANMSRSLPRQGLELDVFYISEQLLTVKKNVENCPNLHTEKSKVEVFAITDEIGINF